METNGRSALFLSTVSSAVVALAFIGQVADDGQPFFLFALAVLPTLFFLGLLTYLRLAQSAGEDLLYSRAINRIRRFYLELDPAAPSWFLLGGRDDIHGATADMGLVASSRHLLSHAATMVAVTISMIGGVFVALAVGGLGGGRVSVAVAAAPGSWSALPSPRHCGVTRPDGGAPPSRACRPRTRPSPTRRRASSQRLPRPPTTPLSVQTTPTRERKRINDINDRSSFAG